MIDAAVTNLIDQHAGPAAGRTVTSTSGVNVNAGLPKVVYTRFGGTRRYTNSGNTGAVQARYQLDIFAATLGEAVAIAAQVRIGLDNFKGSASGVAIHRIYFPGDDSTGSGERPAGAAAAAVRERLDMTVEYREQLTLPPTP